MHQAVKNALGIVIMAAILTFAYASIEYVRSYSKSIQPSSFRSFAVNAEGKIVAVPDVAKFNFTVLTQGGKDLAGLQKENTEKMNKAIEFVKSAGIDGKDIQTTDYNLQPRYQNFSCPPGGGACPPPEIIGYNITQTVAIKARDFTKIDNILSGVIKNGANVVSSLTFTLDDPEKAQKEARTQAIQKAIEKAQATATAGGFQVGRLLSIGEDNQPMPSYQPYFKGYGGESALNSQITSQQGPILEAGSKEIKVNVTLTYEIE